MHSAQLKTAQLKTAQLKTAQLKTAQLGGTDIEIARVGLGAWAIGGSGWEFAGPAEGPYVFTKASLIVGP